MDSETTQGRNVAVLIAAYKAETVIARAIRSALAQPEAAEVVVVVDASPDDTAAAARLADDGTGRLNVIVLPRNSGPSAARNAAIAASVSPWVTVLDDDDFMDEGRLGRLLDLGGNSYDLIADDLLLVDEGAEAGPRRAMWFSQPATAAPLTLTDFVSANIPHKDRPRRELGFLKPLMKRYFLEKNAIRYNESMRLGEDYALYAEALACGARFLLAPSQGYIAVRRPASLSGRHGAPELLALRDADDRLLQRPDLSPDARAALVRHRRSTDKKYRWQKLIDAVKARNPLAAAACFTGHPAVSAFVAAQLWRELRTRTGAATA